MELLATLAVIVINLVVLFFLVRKATRADEQIKLLSQLVAQKLPEEPEVVSPIAKLTAERKERGLNW